MNANEPAFPCDWKDFQPTTGDQVVREQYFGISMRAYIATKLMAGMMGPELPHDYERCAKEAVEGADALIAALSPSTAAAPPPARP